MKSKTSLFSKAVFKHNLCGCWSLWAGLITVYLLLLPFQTYMRLTDIGRTGDEQDLKAWSVYIMMNVLCYMSIWVLLYAFAAVITAMAVFSYLFTARNSNMMHTYPIDRTSLFVTNYFSGALFLILPVIIGALSALAVGAANGAVNGDVVKSYFIWMGMTAIENLFFYSLAVCVIMFVGNIVAVPVLYLIVNFLYRGCVLIADTMISVVCYGLSYYQSATVGFLTPIICMTRIGFRDMGWGNTEFPYPIHGKKELIGYLAAVVILTVTAWIAYQKKQIETAGDVITVGWLKPVFRWGMAVCTSAAGALVISSMGYIYGISFSVILISAALLGIIFFFVAQMLLERSVHVFTEKRIREGIVFTVLLCACYIGLDADILGMEKKIPYTEEIQAVGIAGAGERIYAEDKETIVWARNMHKQMVASKKEIESGVNSREERSGYFSVEYRLSDGSELKRSYENIPYSDAPESLYAQIHTYMEQPEMVLKSYFGVHYPNISVFGGTLENIDDEIYEIRVSEAEAERIYQAVVRDIEAGHLMNNDETSTYMGALILYIRDEDGFKNTEYYFGTVDEEGSINIPVYDNYTYLIQELHEMEYISDERYQELTAQD